MRLLSYCVFIAPVVRTLAVTLPLIEPKSALEKIATLAAPPLTCPKVDRAMLRKKSPPPVAIKATANTMKPRRRLATTLMGIPRKLSDPIT